MHKSYPDVPLEHFIPRCSYPKIQPNSLRNSLDQRHLTSSVKDRFLSSLHMFADETTVHGIWNITRYDKPILHRLIWTLAFATCFVSCFYFLGASIERYLRFEVITTESLQTEKKIEFPAITICNENMARKSLLGKSDVFMKSLTAFIISRPDQFDEKLKKVMATCKDVGNNSSNFSNKLNGYESWQSYGHATLMHHLATDSFYSIVKCWWKNDEKGNCSKYFLNHQTDYGWCFTFNPHPEVIKSYLLGFNQNSSGYGLSDDYEMLTLNSTGPNNGFRILLNAHYDDYCASRHDSVGFQILIHDPRTEPLIFLDRPIFISPGFETRIGIKLHRLVKKTEHLKTCTEYQYLYMYPNAKFYFKAACYIQCFTEYVYKHCSCTPPFGPPRVNYIVAKRLNLSYVNVCWNDETLLCMKKYEREFLDIGLDIECKNCLNPCVQLSYDFQISQLYFPVKSWTRIFPDMALNVSSSTEKFRENYALVDFYVESMTMKDVTETQAFNFEQLVADIGGQLGFLLGMSVLSILEFIQLLIPDRRKPKMALPQKIINEKLSPFY